MRSILLAALSVITFGLVQSGAANAAWQDTIFGTNQFGSSESRSERSAPSERRSTRTARLETSSANDSSERPSRSQRRGRQSESRGESGGSSGMASYYWQPQRVASGGWFNPNAMTAAHKTLPFGTRVRVTNQNNGQSVEVTINDRGPYVAGRVIDLSSAAAGAINMKGSGVVPVKMTVIGR